MLEFQSVCRQVASFASTPAAAEKAYKGRLEVGQTREASEALQRQTREAMRLLGGGNGGTSGSARDESRGEEFFRGVMDLRRALDAAEKDGITLHPLVIGAIATTIEATLRLYDRLVEQASPLADLLAVHMEAEYSPMDLAASIREKISVDDGLILSTASESLGEIRALKDDNSAALQKQAEEWARKMHSCGAAERAQVVIRRDRRCIPIKAGRNGELPQNSVVLGTSGSQSTMYMEPAPIIPLNNFNIELIEAEEEEEEAILKALSEMIARRAGLLRRIGAAVVRIDLAFARAKHAKWMGGLLPEFCDRAVHCENVMHPLLLQPTLEPLATPRLPTRRTTRLGGAAIGSSALDGIDLVPELWDRGGGERGAQNTGDQQRRLAVNSNSGADVGSEIEIAPTHRPAITPISILIPEGKTAVVVTGPNTGGKTASLKTFGLLSLMAKAGLAVPTAAAGSDANCSNDAMVGDHATTAPQLMWFDKVLVDVGDSQSLQQNLSTFSGHMTRISKILDSATPQSLVLLDEVGSGTDPAEGAALAAAILDRLSHGGSAMTYVTTHHAELKENKDPVFMDANVEFDVRTLLPTYKIDWGSSGESHALAVAEGLGFDPAVVALARDIAKGLKEERDEQKRTSDAAAMLKESLPDQIALVESRIEAATRTLEENEMMLGVLKKELEDVQRDAEAVENGASRSMDEVGAPHAASSTGDIEDVGDAKEVIRGILRDARAGVITISDAEQKLRTIADDARDGAKRSLAEVFSDGADENWVPAAGDSVAVLTMGGAQASVISTNTKKQTASIRAGMMVIGDVAFADLRRNDLSRATGKDGAKSNRKAFSRANSKELSNKRTDAESNSVSVQQQPAIQTSQNTVDLRGLTAEEARHEVEAAVGAARSGAVLFVIHGVGTGKVRSSVLASLRKNQRVRKAEQQEGSNGGCAVVYIA